MPPADLPAGWRLEAQYPGALPLLTNAPPPQAPGTSRMGTRTHCQRGHPRTPETRNTRGDCRLCINANQRRRRAQRGGHRR